MLYELINFTLNYFFRLLFWTQFGPPGLIGKAGLDGKNRAVIISDLNSLNGLTIDYEAARLVLGLDQWELSFVLVYWFCSIKTQLYLCRNLVIEKEKVLSGYLLFYHGKTIWGYGQVHK